MNGRAEVKRQRQQLDATFGRANNLVGDAELLSDFSRYLCILVSGYLEQAVVELILEHVKKHSNLSIQRHIELRLRHFTNANLEKICVLLSSFDLGWANDLKVYAIDERKDAVDSVVNLRNTIAHGGYAGVTFIRVKNYYEKINEVLDHIADLCDPL